jgi:hypothetical protein
MDRNKKFPFILAAAIFWGSMLCFWIMSLRFVAAPSSAQAIIKDNEELARLYREDQSDRTAPAGKPIDWFVVGPRDRAREARVKQLYQKDSLQTGADYYHAAMILQHAQTPEDCLLAHEFCIIAISKGNKRALWLAAASEDRFLMNIGRPQRFATQYRSDNGKSPVRLYTVDPNVTDGLRRAFNALSLAEAKTHEKMMNKIR